MSNKKFIIEKETEWKDGEIKNWYYIKLIENDKSTLIHLATNEDDANKSFESAITSYTRSSRTIIREHEVEENK